MSLYLAPRFTWGFCLAVFDTTTPQCLPGPNVSFPSSFLIRLRFSRTSLTSKAHSLTELSPPVLLLSSRNGLSLYSKALSTVCLSAIFHKPDNPWYETPKPQVLHLQSTVFVDINVSNLWIIKMSSVFWIDFFACVNHVTYRSSLSVSVITSLLASRAPLTIR